jgi:ABC-type uncharacterized transport system auxiliary subunit
MNRPLSITLVAAALAGGPFLAGCEKDVSKTETTRVKSDGTVVKQESKTTEGADGSVTKTETKKVDRPDNHDATIKVDVDKK